MVNTQGFKSAAGSPQFKHRNTGKTLSCDAEHFVSLERLNRLEGQEREERQWR
jgi:hypothetical protein